MNVLPQAVTMKRSITYALFSVSGMLLAAAAGLMSPAAQAQPATPNESLPRFTSPTAPAVPQTQLTSPTVTREQAPLPLQTVYNTSIEQFEPPFADVATNHWAYEAVTRLFYSGIVSGFPADQ